MKIAVVGTHGAGKSTAVWHIASELKKEGINSFNALPEVARIDNFNIGEKGDYLSELLMLLTQIKLEAHTQKYHKVVLCDRSVLDVVAYSRIIGLKDPELATIEWIAKVWLSLNPYDLFIFLRPSELQPEEMRSSNTEFQRAVDDELCHLLSVVVPDRVAEVSGSKQEKCDKAFLYVKRCLDAIH